MTFTTNASVAKEAEAEEFKITLLQPLRVGNNFVTTFLNHLYQLVVYVRRDVFNPFLTNVSIKDKPGSWFLLPKCLKNTCGRVTF